MGANNKLIAQEGELQGQELLLKDGDEWVIGRDPDVCQLVIADPAASRRHILCRTSSQGIIVENLSDTNPVLVNGEQADDPVVLRDGDALQIGNGLWRFAAADLHEQQRQEEGAAQALEHESSEETLFEAVEDGSASASFHAIDIDLTQVGRWLLKVVSGPNNGAEFSLQPGNTYLMGTDPNVCDIVFHDTSVSRQHARLSVSNDELFTIEDTNSRNGILVDAEPLKVRQLLDPNILVTLGSTSFVIIDREGQMQTIISPFLPSIVRLLQHKQEVAAEEVALEADKASEKLAEAAKASLESSEQLALPAVNLKPRKQVPSAMILLSCMVIGLVVVTGVAVSALFHPEELVKLEKRDLSKALEAILKPFPAVRYSFSKVTGKLLLVGHVLTSIDRHQLMYDLQAIPEISAIDDKGVIVDEYVWQEANQILARTQAWRGVTVHASVPGKFVLSGYLKTREQADKLFDYISNNFPYLDLLDKQVAIEDDIISSMNNALRKHKFFTVKVLMQDGDVTLSGGIPQTRQQEFQEILKEFPLIGGVREVRNLVFNLAPEQSLVDVSDRYPVTGFSQAGGKMSVVIGRRALYEGDILDGMKVEQITPKTILLDKEGVKYRINYSS